MKMAFDSFGTSLWQRLVAIEFQDVRGRRSHLKRVEVSRVTSPQFLDSRAAIGAFTQRARRNL